MYPDINYHLILPIEHPDVPDAITKTGMSYEPPASFIVRGPKHEYTLFSEQGEMLDIAWKDR